MANEIDEDKSLSLEKIYPNPMTKLGMKKSDGRRRNSMPNAEPGKQHKYPDLPSPELEQRRKKKKFDTPPNDQQAADVLNRNKPEKRRVNVRERAAQILLSDPIPPADNPDEEEDAIVGGGPAPPVDSPPPSPHDPAVAIPEDVRMEKRMSPVRRSASPPFPPMREVRANTPGSGASSGHKRKRNSSN